MSFLSAPVSHRTLLLAGIWACFQGSIHAQTQANAHTPLISWSAEADFNYRYIWEGLAYTNGPVLQPELDISVMNFTVSLWGSQILNNEAHRGELTEYSITAAYCRVWSGWTLEPSYEKWVNHPANADSGPNTGVISMKVSHAAGPIALFTTHTLDIQSFRGAYWGDAGVSWQRSRRPVQFAADARAGWASSRFNAAYIGPAKNALNIVAADFSATISLPDHAYLRPHVELSSIVDKQLRGSLAAPTLWNAGIAIGFSF